jgi:hypothetical protein
MKKKTQKYSVKLKHLGLVSAEKLDYAEVMTQLVGYTNNWFTRKFNFYIKFNKAYELVNKIRQISPTEVELQPDCNIKLPKNIDNISFRAMMELQHLINNGAEENITEVITSIITISCYQSNNLGKYESDSDSFRAFKERISNEPVLDMLGLYNWINESLKESSLIWEERFLSVYVEDREYQIAAGERMNQFNVINSIKSICAEFNIPFEEAWQMSYALVQTSSYSKATVTHIQDQMRQIKEARMKRERQSNQ